MNCYESYLQSFCSRVNLSVYVAVSILITSCSTNVEQGCDTGNPCIPPANAPFEQLSDYGLFSGKMDELRPVEGLVPYDLNTELFSDYAKKQRFVYLPAETSIEIIYRHELDFPVGTFLVKNFYYNKDDRDPSKGRTLIETRLLIRYKDNWRPTTYEWNREQTRARLKRTGENTPVNWTDKNGTVRHVNYRIPSVNDCGSCHRKNGQIIPLGPKNIRNLNKQYFYSNGMENQLERWWANGFFEEEINLDVLPRLPVWNDPDSGPIHLRARAYLDVNCSNCHNQSGSARNSGLYLEFEQEDPYRLGVCKIPVAAGSGAAGLKYGIVPGKPDESILLHRMNSTKPNVRMPEIGRTLIHDEAVGLIREWIETMDLPQCDE